MVLRRSFVKYGCYFINFAMSMVAIVSPILFLTFNKEYNISFASLGTLVLINFFTQMTVDLILSFFSHKFNIKFLIKIMPYLVILGFLIYALIPLFFKPYAYLGLAIGTVLFSMANGLVEVLITPLIENLYSENRESEVSKLHSIYGWGVVVVTVISTLFLRFLGSENWHYLVLLLLIIPITSCVFFSLTDLPDISSEETGKNADNPLKNGGVWLCFFAMVFAGMAECTMSQWSSSFMEKALSLPKVLGDILGVAFFAGMVGLGRTLYSKFGKNVISVLIYGSMLATLCYFVCAISGVAVIGLISCAVTGLAVSMLWPGTLLFASSNNKNSGVVLFALMAAAGDMGAAIGPQVVGTIIDTALTSNYFLDLSVNLNISIDSLAMRFGLLIATIFPLLSTVFAVILKRKYKKKNKTE